MKKNQTQSGRSPLNRKNQHLSPTHFPKKQFEFIYREKDHLPSSQAFQSIIFMKSKKCEPKSTHSLQKNPTKPRKPHVDELKKVMTEIEKQLNEQDGRKNKKSDNHIRPQVLKNSSNSLGSGKKVITDGAKNKSMHRLHKGQKIDIASSDNVATYKNILSPPRHRGQKLADNSHSAKLVKNTQETFRKNTKGKDKRRERKENKEPTTHSSEVSEYILVGGEFVSIDFREVQAIEEKLLSSRDYLSHIKRQENPKKCEIGVKSPIMEDERDEQPLQFCFKNEGRQPGPTPLDSHGDHQIFMEHNLTVVQKYIVSKVKVIQKWWRSVLQKRDNKNASVQQNEDGLDQLQLGQTSKIWQKQEAGEPCFKLCTKMMATTDYGNNSPIKMVDEYFGSSPTNEPEVISSRQNAAKVQLQTHQAILEKLLGSKKITAEIYTERKQMIQAKYFNQLQQIQELRSLINKNAARAVEIQKKTQQDLETLEKDGLVVNTSFLDTIFGVQFSQGFEEEEGQNPITGRTNEYMSNRQKSQGCHYQPQSTVKTSLYDRKNRQIQEYEQNCDEDNERHQNNTDYNDFYSQNCLTGEPLNSNFKDLFGQFKLRQEVKLEIDRRAAVQMGVLVEDIPQQIRDQVVAIDTSLNNIHRFLLAFFKYYLFYNKFDFLRLVNMPFGFNIERRLASMQGYAVEDDFEDDQDEDGIIYGLDKVIPDEMFGQFYQKVYSLGEGVRCSAKVSSYQFEKIHNKALFDCFNESLNYFRPYFFINGPPYPWNYSQKGLTFYFVAEENIQQVFQKTELKVLKWASSLCGLIIPKFSNPTPPVTRQMSHYELIEHYKQASHPLLNETREDRMTKNLKNEMTEFDSQWGCFMEQQTFYSLEIANTIMDKMFEEMTLVLLEQQQKQAQSFRDNFTNEKLLETGQQLFQNMSQNSF